MGQTKYVREALPLIFAKLGVSLLLDVPYSESHRMQHLNLGVIRYIGGDTVEEIITMNQHTSNSRKNLSFKTIDILKDELRRADAVFCRDLRIY